MLDNNHAIGTQKGPTFPPSLGLVPWAYMAEKWDGLIVKNTQFIWAVKPVKMISDSVILLWDAIAVVLKINLNTHCTIMGTK